MFLGLERLEERDCPSAPPLSNPVVIIVGLGVNAADYVPMTQVMVNDYNSLGLNQYGVGKGTIAAVVSLPDPGPISDAQLQSLLASKEADGTFPKLGPNSLVMCYTPGWKITDPWAQASGAYHEGFLYQGQMYRDAITWRQPWESIAATHEYAEATAGQEVADPVSWQSKPLDGINVSNFVLPNGQPAFAPQPRVGGPWQLDAVSPPSAPPPAPPSSAEIIGNLFALAVEKLEADVYGILSRVDLAFTAQANEAAHAIEANPLHHSQQGQIIEYEVDTVFINWLNTLD